MKSVETLAREAGVWAVSHELIPTNSAKFNAKLEHFAALVRDQALEEAAVICEKQAGGPRDGDGDLWRCASIDAAAAIRAAQGGAPA